MAALLKLSLLLVLAYLATAEGRRNHGGNYIVNPFVCAPGLTYKLDCNSCVCNGEKYGSCTLMACNLGPDECIPGSVFEISGELCRCPECGYKWHSDCFAGNYCPL